MGVMGTQEDLPQLPDGPFLAAQSWDVENRFVTDGGCFTSGDTRTPTLTMMGLTVRACSFIVERLKRGEL